LLRLWDFVGVRALVGGGTAGPVLVKASVPTLTRSYWRRCLLFCLFLFLIGCQQIEILGQATPTPALSLLGTPLLPTPTLIVPRTLSTPVLSPPAVSPTIVPDTGWELLRPGLERRVVTLFTGQGQPLETIYLLRLEPAYFQFGVAYRPGLPHSLAQWQADTGALIVVNAGYFTESYIHTGRIVSEGVATGQSYGDFAGMLAVTAVGPELRWLRQQPYDPAEPLLAAVQSFPLLVKPGGELGFPDEDHRFSRRTVVGQDGHGRILFLIAPWGRLSLHQLSRYLVESDLDLQIALNLDGGTSTGLLLAEPAEGFPAFVPLPAVITVHER
jgi:uncharacterized protein YigE (DUF2233 family)